MNTVTVLVWVLVSIGGYGNNTPSYSLPLADLESCQRMQASANEIMSNTGWQKLRSQCVQVKVVK